MAGSDGGRDPFVAAAELLTEGVEDIIAALGGDARAETALAGYIADLFQVVHR